ncbi:MAG: TetR/AcrR family transcriptional regulator [Pseudomonadota bacterium]
MQRARTPEAKDDRRLAIMTAALDEFFEKGYAPARMDDIARRAGVSKGAVYLYFASKDALFAALIDTFAVPNVERIEAIAQSAVSARAAIDAMVAFAPVMIRQSPAPKIARVLISNAHAFPDVVTAYRKSVIERALAAIAGFLERAKARGEIDVEAPALAARLVVAPIVFSALWRIVFEHDESAHFDLDALLRMHKTMLIRGLNMEPAP